MPHGHLEHNYITKPQTILELCQDLLTNPLQHADDRGFPFILENMHLMNHQMAIIECKIAQKSQTKDNMNSCMLGRDAVKSYLIPDFVCLTKPTQTTLVKQAQIQKLPEVYKGKLG